MLQTRKTLIISGYPVAADGLGEVPSSSNARKAASNDSRNLDPDPRPAWEVGS